MYRLNEQQIGIIANDVNRAKLTITRLQDELIDDLCCKVESLMEQGLTFDMAYLQIQTDLGIEHLVAIEEDTLLLTDINYARMKTTMKITGNISLALLAIGTLLRISQVAGANIILVIGFILLSLIFFPAAIFLDYGSTEEKQLTKRLLIIAGCVALMNGVLFKVMYWNGANILLLSGWIIMLGIFLPILFIKKLKETESTKNKLVYALGIFALFIFELATVFKFFHWPGTSFLMVVGTFLLIGCFLPIYSLSILKEKQGSLSIFIFLIILAIYAVTFTALLSVNGAPAPQTVMIELFNQSHLN